MEMKAELGRQLELVSGWLDASTLLVDSLQFPYLPIPEQSRLLRQRDCLVELYSVLTERTFALKT